MNAGQLDDMIRAVGPDFHGLSYRERLIVGAALKFLSTPPAEDLREALTAARNVEQYITDTSDWTDEQLDAAYKAFKAHERGSEFNEFGEHVCSECGYAYSWPEGEDRKQRVFPRRSSRHVARAALEAAKEARS